MTSRAWTACLLALLPFWPQTYVFCEETADWAQDVLIDPDRTQAICFQVMPERAVKAQSEFLLAEPAARVLRAQGMNSALFHKIDRTGAISGRTTVNVSLGLNGTPLKFVRALSFKAVPDRSLLVMARRADWDDGCRLECRLLEPDSPSYGNVLAHFGLDAAQIRPGTAGFDAACRLNGKPQVSRALTEFLPAFDRLTDKGFVTTQRSGSTGIGYTLESLLDIEENNRQGGDFLGMEIKAHRDSEFTAVSSKRMNLFLKEPQWIDGLSHKSRIPKYGYVDDNGRLALYSTVTSRENSHGLSARVDHEKQRVWLQFRGEPVAFWSFDILSGRLAEKLRETVFIGAESRGTGRSEEFHYNSVLYCRDPAVQRFVNLLQDRDVVIEMRMHLKPDGAARNHGTAFRVRQNRIPQLYAVTVKCRSSE